MSLIIIATGALVLTITLVLVGKGIFENEGYSTLRSKRGFLTLFIIIFFAVVIIYTSIFDEDLFINSETIFTELENNGIKIPEFISNMFEDEKKDEARSKYLEIYEDVYNATYKYYLLSETENDNETYRVLLDLKFDVKSAQIELQNFEFNKTDGYIMIDYADKYLELIEDFCIEAISYMDNPTDENYEIFNNTLNEANPTFDKFVEQSDIYLAKYLNENEIQDFYNDFDNYFGFYE